jgi:hypothetical protein
MASTEDVARLSLEAETQGFEEAKSQIYGFADDVQAVAAKSSEAMEHVGQQVEVDAQAFVGAKAEAYGFADAAVASGSKAAGAYDLVEREIRDVATAASAGKSAVTLAMEEIAASGRKAEASLTRVASASASTGNRSQAAARGIVDLSRGLEDFSTGGFLGILNNIPGMFTNLGAALGIARTALLAWTGIVSLAATGLYVLYKNWGNIRSAFTEQNPFPQAAHDVDALKQELDKAKDAMKELEKNSSLTGEQLKEYNALRTKTAEIEARVTAEQARQKDLKDILEAKSKEDTERGSAFMGAAGGKGGQLRQDLLEAENKRRDFELAQEKIAMDNRIRQYMLEQHNIDEVIAYTKKEQERFKAISNKEGIPELVDDLLVALKRGEATAFAHLENLMNAGTGVLIGGDGFRAKLEEAMPAAKAAKKAKDKDAKEWAAEAKEIDDAADEIWKAELKAIKEALEEVVKGKDVADYSARVNRAVATTGATGAEAFRLSRDTVEKEIRKRLSDRGVTAGQLLTGKDAIESAASTVVGQGASQVKREDTSARTSRTAAERKAAAEAKAAATPAAVEKRRLDSLANQVFQRGQGDFTREQAAEIAKNSIKKQKEGLDVNRATLAAMSEAYQAMQQLALQAQQQIAIAGQMQQNFRTFGRQVQMNTPTNLPMGQ